MKIPPRRPASAEVFPHPAYLNTVLGPNFRHAAEFFFKPLIEINQAHAIMLARRGILKKASARRILRALRQMAGEQEKLNDYRFKGAVEDLYFYIECRLSEICGQEIAGQLSVARSRNDVDMTLYRMVLRKELLDTVRGIRQMSEALLQLAVTHVATILPVVTHTQLAQPTTLAHYLLAAVEFLERDQVRAVQAFAHVNQSPLGACVATTTGFPIDRRMLAGLLGFDGVLENAYGCIATVDYLVEGAGTLTTLMVNLGRFIQDLLLWSSQDIGLIELPDGFVQSSSIMPQKRNPVALEHLRILASNAVAQSQSIVLDLHNTPFGDIVDTEDDLQPVVRQAFSYTVRVLELLTAILESLEFRTGKALLKCQGGEITLTELADWLVRTRQVAFRSAHQAVSCVAQELRRRPARRQGESFARRVSLLLEEASGDLLGERICIAPSQISQILDPYHFVRVRRVFGGPAIPVVRQSIRRHMKRAAQLQLWLERTETGLRQYPERLRNV
ncbi:MAG TPA: argininosuccinate lyase [Terriglobia bacterium]|nr:argininosuccinate lyase [Terriglobia bacterium]